MLNLVVRKETARVQKVEVLCFHFFDRADKTPKKLLYCWLVSQSRLEPGKSETQDTSHELEALPVEPTRLA